MGVIQLRTVCCRAVADSVIVRLPSLAFRDVFERSPDAMIRVVQLVMARVQRVIFVALAQFAPGIIHIALGCTDAAESGLIVWLVNQDATRWSSHLLGHIFF